ncbi:hypothetical protein ABEB36_006613 [Hypothenemus hampei]|uniref:VTT domain-containing protein n=1 Tax=Hypothenemus hampei TaxID=57062 RepID=A0ABD1ER54_HYPHA
MKGPIDEEHSSNCCRLRIAVYFLPLRRMLLVIATLLLVVFAVILCKVYIIMALYWMESQDSLVTGISICTLFVIVSLPVSIGYIVLVLASGYLFGMITGLLLVVFGANFGLFIGHNILKLLRDHKALIKYTKSETATAIKQVITGPMCFKIVFCSRLSPIPFGIQNAIFAISNVNAKVYHTASLLGLFPAQLVVVYIGSTLRSMQDVIENNHITSTTYLFAALQVMSVAKLASF